MLPCVEDGCKNFFLQSLTPAMQWLGAYQRGGDRATQTEPLAGWGERWAAALVAASARPRAWASGVRWASTLAVAPG